MWANSKIRNNWTSSGKNSAVTVPVCKILPGCLPCLQLN